MREPTVITSLQNERVKLIRSLEMRKARKETGLFVAEGASILVTAREQGFVPEMLVAQAGAGDSNPIHRGLLQWGLKTDAHVLEVSEAVLGKLAAKDNPQTMMGVFRQRWTEPPKAVDLSPADCWLALEEVRDPGNLGTILRTLDAVGARGVILINDTYHHPGERDALMAFGEANGPTDAGLFFVQVSSDTAEAWIKSAGKDLRTILTDIDRDLKPQSFALPNLTASVTVGIEHETKAVHNVIAYIPGTTDEYIVIGAHYDHLGLGDEHSLAPSQIGQIHHGADDNASGTAGVIELARWFSKQPKPKRGILFMTFAGEELGLLGSAYYTTHPLLPLDKAVTMLNMDMIGRIKDGKIFVNGTGTGSTLDALVAGVKSPQALKVDLSESTGYGGRHWTCGRMHQSRRQKTKHRPLPRQ